MHDRFSAPFALLAASLIAGCALSPQGASRVAAGPDLIGAGQPSPATEQAIADILERHRIVTAGIGVIRDGELVWDRYFGEQAPGVPASAATRFNVASVTKTVAAETILRLAGQGRLSLDEPMAAHWVDPDIADDPRRLALTPRMALNHSTGFPNWRFFLPGRRLTFLHPPGERFTYSGEGMNYVARFAERRLGRPFPELVAETVFGPIGMRDSSVVVRRAESARIARPVDAAGTFFGYWCRPEGAQWCRPEGSWDAADDMVTTVRDFAAFLRAVADGEGYRPAIAADRDRVQTDLGDQRVVDCESVPAGPCPDSQGYGLGFSVLRFGDVTIIGHGGSDWSEMALAYVANPSRSGLIIFLNAPNRRGLAAIPELIERIDPASPFLSEYRRRLAQAQARERGDD